MKNLEHTKALEQKATPGNWHWVHLEGIDESEVYAGPHPMDRYIAGALDRADAEFIAHARTAVPTLVAAVERVQALHTPLPVLLADASYCTGCGDPYPCPTIRELEMKP